MQIFPEDHVDENFFDIYYHPYKKQIWGVGLAFTIVAVGFLAYRELRRSQLDEQWNRYAQALEIRTGSLPGQADPDQVRRQVDALRGLVSEFPDEAVAPFALQAIVDAEVAAGDYDAALGTLGELRSSYPEYPLNRLASGDPGGVSSLADHLQRTIESERSWEAATEYTHPAPSTKRTVIIDTNMGSLQLGFYEDAAPAHVAAFVERAKAGAYNGTQVYEVRRDGDGAPQLVRMGSSASKAERDPALHDRDEPLDTIEPEDSRFTIHHQLGVVSSVDMESGESATAFQIITAPDGLTRYDGRNTVFAAVLDREGSLQTLEKIGGAPTYATNPETAEMSGTFRMRDHPFPPVLIRRVAILADEKVEDGHTWDTSRVGTDAPEPWEADLPKAPLPDEFSAPAPDEDADARDASDTSSGENADDASSDDGDETQDEPSSDE